MAFELLGQDCAKVEILGTEVCELYINNQLVYICGEPPPDTELPVEDFQFSATDNQVNNITMNFSGAGGIPSPTYDLYEDNHLVASGISDGYDLSRVGPHTANYYVVATNSEGSSTSEDDNGTSIAVTVGDPPGTITNFTASGGGDDGGEATSAGVQIFFSQTSNASSYSLWDWDEDIYIEHNVASGEVIDVGHNEVREYSVVANGEGVTASNRDLGQMTTPGDVTIDSTGVSGSNPETVSGSGLNYTFSVPDGVTSVDYIIGGAGGSGSYKSASDSSIDEEAGGGFAGSLVPGSLAVEGNQARVITLGLGGDSVGTGNSSLNGMAGTHTAFDLFVATGGAGGISGHDWTNGANYGAGAWSEVDFLFNTALNVRAYDGEASFRGAGGTAGVADGEDESGAGTPAGDGIFGSGGGGRACSDNTDVGSEGISGRGGDGYVILSWS